MTSRDFCYWLQGFLEINSVSADPRFVSGVHPDGFCIDHKQTECIKKHLALVFVHEIDPSMGDAKKQQVLNEIHNQNPKSIIVPEDATFDKPEEPVRPYPPTRPGGPTMYRC